MRRRLRRRWRWRRPERAMVRPTRRGPVMGWWRPMQFVLRMERLRLDGLVRLIQIGMMRPRGVERVMGTWMWMDPEWVMV